MSKLGASVKELQALRQFLEEEGLLSSGAINNILANPSVSIGIAAGVYTAIDTNVRAHLAAAGHERRTLNRITKFVDRKGNVKFSRHSSLPGFTEVSEKPVFTGDMGLGGRVGFDVPTSLGDGPRSQVKEEEEKHDKDIPQERIDSLTTDFKSFLDTLAETGMDLPSHVFDRFRNRLSELGISFDDINFGSLTGTRKDLWGKLRKKITGSPPRGDPPSGSRTTTGTSKPPKEVKKPTGIERPPTTDIDDKTKSKPGGDKPPGGSTTITKIDPKPEDDDDDDDEDKIPPSLANKEIAKHIRQIGSMRATWNHGPGIELFGDDIEEAKYIETEQNAWDNNFFVRELDLDNPGVIMQLQEYGKKEMNANLLASDGTRGFYYDPNSGYTPSNDVHQRGSELHPFRPALCEHDYKLKSSYARRPETVMRGSDSTRLLASY